MDSPNTLKDPTCKVEPGKLVLDEVKLHETGVNLICLHQDTDHLLLTSKEVVLKKSNFCVLLCNFHHIMSIRPKLLADGSFKWWLIRTGLLFYKYKAVCLFVHLSETS